MIWEHTWLDALAAFGLGYSVYRWWKAAPAKWVWVAGFCWFVQRAILLAGALNLQRAAQHSRPVGGSSPKT